jgi:hypothetical protein
MTVTLFQERFRSILGRRKNAPDESVFGAKVGLIATIFGCWHSNVSRPFGSGSKTYRACLDCGARQPFDLEKFKSRGRYYYPPKLKVFDPFFESASRTHGQQPSTRANVPPN